MYTAYPSSRELAPFIECYWHWTMEGHSGEQQVILPDAAPELIVHLGSVPRAWSGQGWRRQAREFLYCAAQRCLELRIDAPMEIFAIRFRPWGLGRFSQHPVSGLLDRELEPGIALGALGETLVARVRGAQAEARAAAVDELLTQALESQAEKAKSIDVLIEALGGSDRPVEVMADRLGNSSRTINRLWRQLVGISPRAYAKLMRVHRALALIEQGAALAAVAADCGFSDQAHMARQIKEITGLPPSRMQSWLGDQVYQDLYVQRPQAPWQRAPRE